MNPILVDYVSGATDNLDKDYDAKLMIQGADSLYYILGDEKLAIQGRQYPINENDVIPLGAVFYETGTRTISLANRDGVFAIGYPIYLHDLQEGTYTKLQNEKYTFEAKKGEVKDRFEIVYQTPFRMLSTVENNKYGLVVYQSGNNYIIRADKAFDEVKIFDASGRLIDTLNSGKEQLIVEKSKLNQGVNIFSIIFADEIINKKILAQ